MAVFISIRTTVNGKDEQFFKALGVRVAKARKARNLTQQQIDRISKLPKTKQHTVMGRLDMVLASQAGH